MTASRTLKIAVASVVLFCGAAEPGAAAEERPNILWLITEDMGPELACYGTEQVSTPVLDSLAERGMRFDNAFTVTPVCSTSRSGFCTGMYSAFIGAHQHRTRDKKPLPEGVRPITHWLRDEGYYTANMSGGSADLDRSGKVDWNFTIEGKPFMGNSWDELKDHQPFYAQINFSQSHRKFTAPKHADPDKVKIPPYYPDHPVVKEDWAAYLDEVTEVDGLIGGVLERLERDGLADNTIIFMFGDHGRAHVRGKQFPYDSGLKIPMILYIPPALDKPTGYTPGAVDKRVVQSIDITASTLAFAGMDKPESMQGRILFGDGAERDRRFAFATRDRCDMTVFRIRTARDGHYRYIRNLMPDRPFFNLNIYKEQSYPMIAAMRELHLQGKLNAAQDYLFEMTRPDEELYFIDDDPYEINNLADSTDPKHQAAKERLSGALDRWIAQNDDPARTLEDPEVGLKELLAKVNSMPPDQLADIQKIVDQQRASPGISDYYAGYLDTATQYITDALKAKPPDEAGGKGQGRRARRNRGE